MQNFFVSSVCSLVLVLGCKGKDKEAPPAPPPATDPVGSGSAVATGSGSDTGSAAGSPSPAGAGGFQLAAGETYYGGKASATNFVEWKVEDGSIVQLAIVTTRHADGTEDSALRAYSASTPSYQVGAPFKLDATKDHWAELTPVANNRMLFRYGADGESRSARNAMLLRWDPASKRIVIVKRWRGVFKDAEPTWLKTGAYVVVENTATQNNCLKVIAKMVACEKDVSFREAMFARAKADDRPAMHAHFDTHVAKWKAGPEAKAQCKRWASDDYVDTHFAEQAKLVNLAEDTKLTCPEFAREVVDDGGLPVALTDANPR